MVEVVAGKVRWTVSIAALARTNATAGAEHGVVDAKAIKASLTIVGGGAASAQWAVSWGGCRFTDTAIANKTAVALAAVGACAAASAHTNLTGAAIAVAGALWSHWGLANAAVANFAISAFGIVKASAASARPATQTGRTIVGVSTLGL